MEEIGCTTHHQRNPSRIRCGQVYKGGLRRHFCLLAANPLRCCAAWARSWRAAQQSCCCAGPLLPTPASHQHHTAVPTPHTPIRFHQECVVCACVGVGGSSSTEYSIRARMLSRGLRQPERVQPGKGLYDGYALPTGDGRDLRREAALMRHHAAMSTAAVPSPSAAGAHMTRAEKVRQYQEMIEGGPGSKYPHADHVPGGGTQIAGMSVQTASMTADFDSPIFFKNASNVLAKGAPAIRGSLDPIRTFRLA